MKRSWLWTATGALALATTTAITTIAILSQDGVPTDAIRASLHSKKLGESRDYVVHLPASYRCDPQRRYAVAYVLDAGPQFITMVQSSSLLARLGLAAELIVVGIPSPDDTSRQRDYTPPGMRQDVDRADSPAGEADRFLGFIRDELIVEIERRYRSNRIRILSGHSRGGLFVVHSLLAAPELFTARFAHSPALWRDDHAMLKRLRAQLPQLPDETYLFLSLGDDENEKMRAGYDAALQALATTAPDTVRWSHELSVGADHGSNMAMATPIALYRYFTAGSGTAPTTGRIPDACRHHPPKRASTTGAGIVLAPAVRRVVACNGVAHEASHHLSDRGHGRIARPRRPCWRQQRHAQPKAAATAEHRTALPQPVPELHVWRQQHVVRLELPGLPARWAGADPDAREQCFAIALGS